MQRFKNILVAVDCAQGDHSASADFPPPTVEAIERAVWLAKLNSARLTFFSALDISSGDPRSVEETSSGKAAAAAANEGLAKLVEQAVADNVAAEKQVQFGKSWMEIIRHVIRHQNDLVVAGTRQRQRGAADGFLMGSTGIKLLRKCPCPVWITQPRPKPEIKSVLVAHCLRSVGDLAMELGCSLAELHNAKLHVLHSLEFPELDSAFPERIPAEKITQFRNKAKTHLDSQLAGCQLADSPEIHIVTESPDFAILQHIERHNIEVVVMGTIARGGIAGFLTGNTAERLLPRIPCSVLAVKPAGFVSPVLAE